MHGGLSPTLDRAAFEELVEQQRPELQLHCYRMLGSVHDAEDAVQEAFLHAWRGRGTFDGRGSLRGWVYRIATNVCLRALERRAIARRMLPEAQGPAVSFAPLGEAAREVPWLEPYPVSPLDLARDPAPGPEARYTAREAVRLAFVAAVQALPPRQRAALLLRDVLGMSAQETAAILETSVAAANSTLQRARSTMDVRYHREQPSAARVPDTSQQALIERYVKAWEAADVEGFVRLLAADASWSMPPWPEWYVGPADISAFLGWAWRRGAGYGRLLPTWANGEPAFGYYRCSREDGRWWPFAIQVLELRGNAVSSITNFVEAGLLATFGLPPVPEGVPGADRLTDESGTPGGSNEVGRPARGGPQPSRTSEEGVP